MRLIIFFVLELYYITHYIVHTERNIHIAKTKDDINIYIYKEEKIFPVAFNFSIEAAIVVGIKDIFFGVYSTLGLSL